MWSKKMQTGRLYIDGTWIDGAGEAISSTNPITSDILLEGKSATTEDVKKAIHAARNAFMSWALVSFDQRKAILEKYQETLSEKADEIANLIANETGKVLWEAKTEVATMIGKINLSIKAYQDRSGTNSSENSGIITHLSHKPHGVVAIFGPFNFPGHLPNGHIVPALLAGNTVVFKPSEQTPAVGEMMVQCLEAAGLPKGVLNLVQGSRNCGIALSTDEGIDGLFFTGSSHTGNLLHSEFAGQPSKILALEMGGNNPLIVTDTSDIKGAIYHTLQSAFITAGQRCTCARRLILPETSDREEFLTRLIKAASKLKIGPQADDSEPFCGSVISNETADNLLESQNKLVDLGGTVLLEMKRIHAEQPYLSAGIIDVTDIKILPDEEYFGPLLQVIRVPNFAQAITVANNTKYGLSAGLFSDDAEQFATFHALSRAGIVNWNRPLTGASGANPFGGIGASGNHRPSAFYAADYCAYPVASLQAPSADLPEKQMPGIVL